LTPTAFDGTGKWVLVPGTLCTGRVFDPLLDELGVKRGDRYVITPDAPDVRDYDARLREAVKGGEIICGFSLGALILAHNLEALKHAQAVVLLASNPFPDPPANRASREAVRDRILAGGARGWVIENWAAMSTSSREDLRDFVASMAEETAELIPAQSELAASRPGARDDLAKTDLPLIFVTGSADRLTPSNLLSTLVEDAKDAQLHRVEGLGHFALIEAPDQVARAIRNGLKEIVRNS
jgi:pimeloyl-ACP methyl ester carboxylesterase